MSALARFVQRRPAATSCPLVVQPRAFLCGNEQTTIVPRGRSILRCYRFATHGIRFVSHRPLKLENPVPTSFRNTEDVQSLANGDRARDRKFRFKETPSEALIAALQERGLDVDIAKPRSYQTDLSWATPSQAAKKEWRVESFARHGQACQKREARLSYATIVANYIRYVDPHLSLESSTLHDKSPDTRPLDMALLRVFDNKTMDYLSQRGYSPSDVMAWAWILLSPQPVTAAMRLDALNQASSRNKLASSKRTPMFVLMFTLRRERINLKAFDLLLVQSWNMLLENPPSKAMLQSLPDKQPMHPLKPVWIDAGDDTTVMILFVRLVRLARRISPEALLSLSQMFTTMFGVDAVGAAINDKLTRRLIEYYNKFLALLAIPCRMEPYASTVVQQRSIFHLLREMTRFYPPLAVTREGYHAVTRNQAARQKLPAERKWAEFKAKSWPPWKEDKLGIDVDRGVEGSKSKAMGAIAHMKEAGYSPTRWDRIATILAGWDLDGTPTIQTRSFLPKPNIYRMRDQHTTWLKSNSKEAAIELSLGSRPEDGYSDIWAARIRATRTMREAWACFLSCRDQGFRITNDIYLELTEKVIYHSHLKESSIPRSTEVLPGDGKEVYPEPSSPRDMIYVRSEPPTLEALAQHLLTTKTKFSRRLSVLLFRHLTSFKLGLECLSHCELSQQQIDALISPFSHEVPSRRRHLDCIPDDVFASFIRFLCRFTGPSMPFSGEPKFSLSRLFPIVYPKPKEDKGSSNTQREITVDESLAHAISLVRLRMPEYLPAWNYLLASLANTRLPADSHAPLLMQQILAWREVREVVIWMERRNISLDATGFQSVCEALSRFLLTIRNKGRSMEFSPSQHTLGNPIRHPSSTATELVTTSTDLVKRKFDQMVLAKDGPLFPSASEEVVVSRSPNYPILPSMYTVPSPFTLHAFVRVLGLAADFESLVILLKWMTRNASDLKRAMAKINGGKRSLRQTVVAVRVYFEKDPSFTACSASAEIENGYLDSDLRPHSDEDVVPEWTPSPIEALYREAQAVIEGSDCFSPWPTDNEVRDYVANHKGLF
ncbi:predicted protein [Uncinocarpus reesii 1704]|uniref:Uncharacterized protein n=1 Tax=Uncinocarpus reesii (strain UAMH 1704) TaxID=336963 RepID=C4JZ36_UNCRE|nr:uncharacterized protein UREG_07437 [Uncinocarpus reesii 1704]EEP82572.1 predicted protein [Uncinocarpus reesii 1704]